MMKADYDKWINEQSFDYGDWLENESKYINQFAEDYGKKCLEEAFNAGMFYQSQLPKDLNMNFNEWYNQKFKNDES